MFDSSKSHENVTGCRVAIKKAEGTLKVTAWNVESEPNEGCGKREKRRRCGGWEEDDEDGDISSRELGAFMSDDGHLSRSETAGRSLAAGELYMIVCVCVCVCVYVWMLPLNKRAE